MKQIYILPLCCCFLFSSLLAQNDFYNNGELITIENGATLYVKGTVTNANGGTFDNHGTVEIDLVGSTTEGDFDNQATSTFTNDGSLLLKGNFNNSGIFQHGSSGARLVNFNRGGSSTVDQEITGTMDGVGGVNKFYNIDLNVSSIIGGQEFRGIGISGITGSTVAIENNINFTNGLLKTGSKDLYITNNDPAAITGYGSFKYVDTDGGGNLKREIRTTPGTHTYYWPIGGGSEKYAPGELVIRSNTNSVSAISGKFTPMTNVGYVPYPWQQFATPCPGLPNSQQWVNIDAMIRQWGNWSFTPDGASTGYDYDMTGWIDDPTAANLTDHNAGGAPYVIYKMIKTDQTPNPLANWGGYIESSGDLCSISVDPQAGVSAIGLFDFSNFGIGGGSAIGLPVELLYLQADAVDNQYIKVHWATAVEVNNAGFHVQRSLDGVSFEIIGWVDGNGTISTQQNYFLDDHNVMTDVIYYYRLKQVDFNGEFEFTDIVQATLNAGEIFTISNFYPSPTEHNASIQITSTVEKEINITVYNMLGQILFSNDYDIVKGKREITYDFSDLPSATYHAIISAGNEVYNKQIVVTR